MSKGGRLTLVEHILEICHLGDVSSGQSRFARRRSRYFLTQTRECVGMTK